MTPPPTTPEEQREEHRSEPGHSKPVFGCPDCTEDRDNWTCGCGDMHYKWHRACGVCKQQRPNRCKPATAQGRHRR